MKRSLERARQIKIYVINFARSPERREKMVKRLSELELSFEFFDAVDGAMLTPKEISSVSNRLITFERLGRDLHPNEMACSWSHIKIYEKMVRDSIEESVILEDDVNLTDAFPKVIATRRDWLPPDWTLVNFAHDMSTPLPINKFEVSGLELLSLCRFDKVVGRTGAYLINLRTARKLLASAYPIRMPPDDLAGDSRFVGGPIYGIIPRVAIWDENLFSTIWTDRSREDFAFESRKSSTGIILRAFSRLLRFLKYKT